MATRLLSLSLMLLLEPVLSFSVPTFDRGAASMIWTKRDNSCPSGNYTAPNGLQFQPFCLQNVPFYDIVNTNVDNMEDCMNLCAGFGSENGETCWGIAYNFNDQLCYYKNRSIVNTNPVKDYQTHSAFAVNINTNPNTACPWTNTSDHSTPNGMDFKVLCDQDLPFNDFCPIGGAASTLPRADGLCPYHADSLEECMELCSQTHPLCKAVAYNPDMGGGYGNCYPKSDFSALGYISNPSLHMAVAANLPTLNSSCTNGSVYTAPNNEQFTVSCNENRAYHDLIQLHSANLSYCIDSCASYSNATTGDCVAVVYDSTLNSGWQNCWLKFANGDPGTVAGNFYALKVGKVPTNTNGSSSGSSTSTTSNSASSSSSNNSSGSNSGSKAWIAGPVVGGIVGIALLSAGMLYFLRRNKSKQNMTHMPPGYAEHAPMYKLQPVTHEADGSDAQELSTENTTYELPANVER